MPLNDKKTFKVLSIDGGGIKGLYSARVLQHFEEQFKCQISDYFDMICGTSTGGLIALGLSLKIPASELADFYVQKGRIIFPDRHSNILLKLRGIIQQTFWKGKYSDKGLKEELIQVFGDKKLGQSNNLLCIPSFNITEGRPWVFKYDHTNLVRDNKTPYVDVALATSAAPTYFPMAQIPQYDNRQFVDGGVWANNPSLVGYLEALDYFVGNQKEYTDLSIMSISSLSLTGGKKTGINRYRPFINWRDELFETGMTGQGFFVDYFLKTIKDINGVPLHYMRIPSAEISSEQESLIQLDNASTNAINLISGKGNDQGLIYRKMPEVEVFFKQPKTYKIK